MTTPSKPHPLITLSSFLEPEPRSPAAARAAIDRMPRTAFEQRAQNTSAKVLDEIRLENEAGAAKTLRLRTARLAREAADKAAAAAMKVEAPKKARRKA